MVALAGPWGRVGGDSSASSHVDASSACSQRSAADSERLFVVESIAFIHAVMPFSCSTMSSSLAFVSVFCRSTVPIAAEICCSTAEGPRFFGARSDTRSTNQIGGSCRAMGITAGNESAADRTAD